MIRDPRQVNEAMRATMREQHADRVRDGERERLAGRLRRRGLLGRWLDRRAIRRADRNV
ncbi:MAG TPA: hypothetical protein VFP41_04020 [Actinomycetota bacterium]|jgi:hypothetical protein|nr:hypothetical protein [Actinomycetota bacterium]